MKKYLKKMVAAVAAFAVAFTAVAAVQVTTAKAAETPDVLYVSSTVESLAAGEEKKFPFTVSRSGSLGFTVLVPSQVSYTVSLYKGDTLLDMEDNPMQISAGSSGWSYDQSLGAWMYTDVVPSLPNGEYNYGIKFNTDTQYQFLIQQAKAEAKISQTKATVTAGFTTKLSVTGAKVKSWSSSKKTVATVDSKGKVTGKKAGKATISAKLDNGKTVKCTVTVKANKYSFSKPTTSDVSAGDAVMSVYSMSYDAKGNLVIKARYVNNSSYKAVALEKIKITVKDGNGKAVGTFTQSKKTVSVPSYSTKDLSFTISKSKLKQKKVDLRNCSRPKCEGLFDYYRY